MLRKDHCLPVNAEFASVSYIFFPKQTEYDTCYELRRPVCEYTTPLTVEDRLLINIAQTEKGRIVEKSHSWVSGETVEMAHAVWTLINNWIYGLR